GHGLHEVIQLVQPGGDDGLAQRLEAPHVQRYVIVDQENRSSAVIAGIANVRQHAVERVSKEVAAAHLDDGTETAIVGAAARGLDYVHLPAEQRISLEHACIAVRRADFAVFEPVRRPVGVVHPALAVSVSASATSVREATDPVDTRSLLDCSQQFAERDFPLAAHQIINVHFLVSFGSKAGVVPSHHDLHSRPESADQFDKASGGTPLKRHDGESDNLRIELADKAGDGLANLALNQDQISHRHAVVLINV